MQTISADMAEDIVYGEHVAIQDVEEHRWYTTQLVVFEHEDDLWGFYYLDPASELQEDQDRFESDPVKIFPVDGREVTTVIYGKRD